MTEIQPENKRAQISTLSIHGVRVFLRRPEMYDAENVFMWERDDEVWRYDPHRPYSRTMRDFLPTFERNYVRGNGRQFWFIIEDEQHTPIGTITYFNIDQRLGQVELGLGLGEKNRWGQGYGPEAIRTLAHYLFQSLPGIMRVYAETAVANRPARRAFAKAGFAEVGQIYDPRSTGDPWMLLEIWRTQVEQIQADQLQG
ncbi:MAG TPA: GNAT family N-acetyltransferase [Ktedonobacteraceae bacterium]|jgi:ribosomal-protein-alanine N-acetyltransferase|nr:GNAT family N-acetyltransferase [Ktedonobacteraceae bacterium]